MVLVSVASYSFLQPIAAFETMFKPLDAMFEALIVWNKAIGRAISTWQDSFPAPNFDKVVSNTAPNETQPQRTAKGTTFACLWLIVLIVAWPLAYVAAYIWTVLMVR